jgi:type II secretory pathway pseudopilin PulG
MNSKQASKRVRELERDQAFKSSREEQQRERRGEQREERRTHATLPTNLQEINAGIIERRNSLAQRLPRPRREELLVVRKLGDTGPDIVVRGAQQTALHTGTRSW